MRGHHGLPGIDAALAGTEWAIQGLRLATDLGKIPIRMQTAQQQAAQQNGKADTSRGGFDYPRYRHCEDLFRPVESSDGEVCQHKKQWHPAIMPPVVGEPRLSS
ncbi:hypothetical protein D3C73_1260790 [compost metagenome]